MRVVVSVSGLFHGHYLAAQLERYGALDRFITSYPLPYMLRRSPARIPWHRLRCNNLQLAEVAARQLGLARSRRFERAIRDAHDVFTSALSYRKTDILVGWSGGSIRAIRTAKRKGITTIIVRGSSHIQEQRRLLEEEHARFGIPFSFPDEEVERELTEYQEADYIQTNSTFARDTMIARGIGRERILVNNTGTDTSLFRQLDKTDDVFRVVVAGTLSLRKGSYYLLKAFCELKLPGAELIHLGAVSDEIRPIVQPYLADPAVKLPGFKPLTELHRYYSQGSVLVMPSIEEGLAQVQAQGMACGLPLICSTNSGGADLAAGGAGFVVPIRDTDALKDKLSYLYEHREECRHKGETAKRRIREHFTWDAYGARMIAIYRALLDR